MARVGLHGLTIPATKANLSTTTYVATASINGRITANTKGSGKTTKCTDTAYSTGLMAVSTRGSISKTRKKERAFFHGLMVVGTRDLGSKASNTEREPLLIDRASRKLGSGSMANEFGGMTTWAMPSTQKRRKVHATNALAICDI
jgi:hypothetical protein